MMANENERLRQSRLKKINYSISAFFNEEEEDFSDNKSVKLGHLVHQMVFEKDKKILCAPELSKASRIYKAISAMRINKKQLSITDKKVKKQTDDVYEVSKEEHDEIFEIIEEYKDWYDNFESPNIYFHNKKDIEKADKIRYFIEKNDHARSILSACRHNFEKKIDWEYKGLKFSSTPDFWAEESDIGSILGDLKIVHNTEPYSIRKSILNEIDGGYAYQLACYATAIREVYGIEIENFYIIFAQSSAPFDVFPKLISRKIIDIGAEQFEKSIQKYKYCIENNITQSNNEVEEIDL